MDVTLNIGNFSLSSLSVLIIGIMDRFDLMNEIDPKKKSVEKLEFHLGTSISSNSPELSVLTYIKKTKKKLCFCFPISRLLAPSFSLQPLDFSSANLIDYNQIFKYL